MKTIKIFLASSSELACDRNAFGNFIRQLDDIYEKRGWRIKLFEWEDYDSAWNNRRKQEEYNDKVRECDIFLALFHQKAGKYTREEFDIAREVYLQKGSPKIHVYCKLLNNGDEESSELISFKEYLLNDLNYFICQYNCHESLQYHFVMQLHLWENDRFDPFEIRDDTVYFRELKVASMRNLSFVQKDKNYLDLINKIQFIQHEIIKKRLVLESNSNNQQDRSELLDLQKQYSQLKYEKNQYSRMILDVSKRFAVYQGQQIDEGIREAAKCYYEGNTHEANLLLNELSKESINIFEDYRKSKEILEQKRKNVINSINCIRLNIATMKADKVISVDYRISKIEELYIQAKELAIEAEYDKKDYIYLIYEFGDFYTRINRLEDAKKCFEEILSLLQEGDIYELSKLDLANVYTRLGEIRSKLTPKDVNTIEMDYGIALHITKEFAQKDKKYLFCLAETLSTFSQYYFCHRNLPVAESYCQEAVNIYKQILESGNNDYEIEYAKAKAQHAQILLDMDASFNVDTIAKNYEEALNIFEKLSSPINIVKTLINRGNFYFKYKLNNKAENDYKRALSELGQLNYSIEINEVYDTKAKILYNLILTQKAVNIELFRNDIENEYKEVLGLYIDLESINYGTYIQKILKVIDEIGFFYQTYGNVDELNSFKEDILKRMAYLDLKSEGNYSNAIFDISAAMLKYKMSI